MVSFSQNFNDYCYSLNTHMNFEIINPAMLIVIHVVRLNDMLSAKLKMLKPVSISWHLLGKSEFLTVCA